MPSTTSDAEESKGLYTAEELDSLGIEHSDPPSPLCEYCGKSLKVGSRPQLPRIDLWLAETVGLHCKGLGKVSRCVCAPASALLPKRRGEPMPSGGIFHHTECLGTLRHSFGPPGGGSMALRCFRAGFGARGRLSCREPRRVGGRQCAEGMRRKPETGMELD